LLHDRNRLHVHLNGLSDFEGNLCSRTHHATHSTSGSLDYHARCKHIGFYQFNLREIMRFCEIQIEDGNFFQELKSQHNL